MAPGPSPSGALGPGRGHSDRGVRAGNCVSGGLRSAVRMLLWSSGAPPQEEAEGRRVVDMTPNSPLDR